MKNIEVTREVRKFFEDYKLAKARLKYLNIKKLYRKDTDTDTDTEEIEKIKLYIDTVDNIVCEIGYPGNVILREYYIDNKSLDKISSNICYAYGATSRAKVQASKTLYNVIYNNQPFQSSLSNLICM